MRLPLLWTRSRQSQLRRNLKHADGFRARLAVDRQRADRMGIAITLATLKWQDGRDAGEAAARVFDLLDARLRATDELGRLADNEIGVVLWDTDEAGASVFVERLLSEAPEDLGLEAALFVYPAGDEDSEARPPRTGGGVTEGGEAAESSLPVGDLGHAMACGVSPVRRAIDIAGASIGLLLAGPVLAVAAIAIKATSRGPVMFVQQRAGLGGAPFAIYKLRTMCQGADAMKARLKSQSEQDGAAFKMSSDPRVTAIGSILRKTSLDELPQLWNVLIGDMSLVGPRPLPVEEAEEVAGWQRRRLDVMPGLTCIWQVEGRSRVSFVEWMRMDLRYIRRPSLVSDLRLMAATVPAVLARRGAK